MLKQKNHKIIFALICLLLFIGLMYWTNRMFVNNYIRETFADGITHTVNLPINTTTSCKNMCGPPNRCSITGTECLSDIDCYGCQPETKKETNECLTDNVSPYDATGKLGQNQGLQYSSLTTGYNNNNINNNNILIDILIKM